jgi:rubrerythrin
MGGFTMDHSEHLIKIFEYALEQEYTGKSFFENSLQRMGIGAAVTAFKSLIREEEKHIRLITRILSGLRKKEEIELPNEKNLTLEPTHYFNKRSKSEFLEQCLEGSMVPEVTIFNTAWLIEKDLSEFYEKTARQTTGKARRALAFLSKWEKEHEKFFREYRNRFSEAYSKMAWGG